MYVLGDPVNHSDSKGTYLDCDDDSCSEADCDGDPVACSLDEQNSDDSGSGGGANCNSVIAVACVPTFTATGTSCSTANEVYDQQTGQCDMPIYGFLGQGAAIAQAIGQNGSAMNTAIAAFAGASIVAGAFVAAPAVLAPDTLYHFTTTAGYQGITAAGHITPGTGLTGVGVYGTALNNAATVSWAGISTQGVVVFSPGMSAVIPAIPLPGLWWVVVPTVTTIFNSGVPASLGR
jgi:hypothetical protein